MATNISINHFFLGNDIFVTLNECNNEIHVFISKYLLKRDGGWVFQRDIIKFSSKLWYEFTQKINIDEPFFIPQHLIVYKKVNTYFIQKLHTKSDNFHIISKERCYLNELQWNALKHFQTDIYNRIIYLSFGNLLTTILSTKSNNIQNSFIKELCNLIFENLKTRFEMEGDRVQTWNRYFYKFALYINIENLAKLFWKNYKVVIDTREDVNAIFQNVYNMYLSLEK